MAQPPVGLYHFLVHSIPFSFLYSSISFHFHRIPFRLVTTSILFVSLRFYSLSFHSLPCSARDLSTLCVYKTTVRLVGSPKLDLVNISTCLSLKHLSDLLSPISLSSLTCERLATSLGVVIYRQQLSPRASQRVTSCSR